MRLLYLLSILCFAIACTNTAPNISSTKDDTLYKQDITEQPLPADITYGQDTLILSAQHHPNFFIADLDGDNQADSVKMVQHINNKKYGLLIKFANNKSTTLGLGQDVLQQGFDDLDWVGIFEKAGKGNVYFNNVNDEGEIIPEEEVPEKDKIRLPNDAIFIHAAESCGGGVIYYHAGKFHWIQQE